MIAWGWCVRPTENGGLDTGLRLVPTDRQTMESVMIRFRETDQEITVANVCSVNLYGRHHDISLVSGVQISVNRPQDVRLSTFSYEDHSYYVVEVSG
jgi:hypothetical protein